MPEKNFEKKISEKPKSEKIEAKERFEKDEQKLSDAFNTLLNCRMGNTCADHKEKNFSGDAATLYTLALMKNEEDEIKPTLIHAGWGEFSQETFESDKYPEFHDLPIDLYCVRQKDSYLANEKQTQLKEEDPITYLKENCFFSAKNGEVTMSKRDEEYYSQRHLEKEITAIPHEDLLKTLRNQIILHKSSPEEFGNFLKDLPDDPDKLGKYIYDIENKIKYLSYTEKQIADENILKEERKKWLMDYIKGMGVERVGINVGDSKAMASVLELKKKFNFETNLFD